MVCYVLGDRSFVCDLSNFIAIRSPLIKSHETKKSFTTALQSKEMFIHVRKMKKRVNALTSLASRRDHVFPKLLTRLIVLWLDLLIILI